MPNDRRVWIWRDKEDREVVWIETGEPLAVANMIIAHPDAILVINARADETGHITLRAKE